MCVWRGFLLLVTEAEKTVGHETAGGGCGVLQIFGG